MNSLLYFSSWNIANIKNLTVHNQGGINDGCRTMKCQAYARETDRIKVFWVGASLAFSYRQPFLFLFNFKKSIYSWWKEWHMNGVRTVHAYALAWTQCHVVQPAIHEFETRGPASKTSAPIGAWKWNFPPFQEIRTEIVKDIPTDRWTRVTEMFFSSYQYWTCVSKV